MKIRVASLCAAILTAWAAAQPAAQQRPRETFRSVRDVLTIDTSVSAANDAPLDDLKADDFTVRVDGEIRQVLTVHRFGAEPTTVRTDTAPIARFIRAAEAAPGRAVVLVIDRPSIKPGSERAALRTASALIEALSPADAVAAIGLPGGGVDLTRDHAAVAEAITSMTGTQPASDWQHFMSWDEALGYEREDRITIARVVDRECQNIKQAGSFAPPDPCPSSLVRQAHEMLLQGRTQAQSTLATITDLLSRIAPLHAPKHMVILSGGLVFDTDVYARYRLLAQQAAESHVALSIVQLDQDLDASDRGHWSNVFGDRDYATGLATIASMTGGSFFMGVGRATGAFERIATVITHFYELGVESRPSDADGKAHRIEVKVARDGVKIRAPSETAVARPAAAGRADALASALTEPTDVAELPLEIATYSTHSVDPEKVGVIVAAQLPPDAAAVPSDWGYVVIQDGKVVGGSKVHVDAGAAAPWAASVKLDIAAGRYRLRAAVVTADGRIGTLDIPLRVGLRQAGTVYASDLVVGTGDEGRLQPRSRVRQDERGVGMIELSSSESLADTGGEILLIRGGTADPIARRPLTLRTRDDDKSIVVAEAALDLKSLPPGLYTASAVLQKGGAPIARVSRVFEVLAGAATPSTASAAVPAAPPGSPAAPLSRDPGTDELIHRVGDYVARYGADASVLVAVERYRQGVVDVSSSAAFDGVRALPTPRGGSLRPPSTSVAADQASTTEQRLVSEIALVQNAAAIGGWLAYRDVIEVNGKAVPDRRERLLALFKDREPDLEGARRVTAESARYNVGPVTRTFNVPTATLFFFDSAHGSRFTFQRAGSDRIGGVETVKVDFQEAHKPSMIMTSSGGDMPVAGTLWIDPRDGSVLKTRLIIAQYRGARSRAEVEVTYRKDDVLGMLVPERMAERYLTPMASITGEATYSDFKRFQTSAKVK